MTELVECLAHPNLWVNRETATITGVDIDVQAARTVCCILREDLEPRALEEGQSLIIAAALYHRPAGETKTYAETLFDLHGLEDKCTWLRKYVNWFPRYISQRAEAYTTVSLSQVYGPPIQASHSPLRPGRRPRNPQPECLSPS